MGKNIITYIAATVCLILVQVLICNHIMLFNVAMAFVFIYVIISLPMDFNTNWLLTWAFLSGLLVDIFSDTPGVNALACTFLAILKKPVLYAYIPRDDRTKNIEPSLASLGFGVYAKYLLTMVGFYCFSAFSIEYASLAAIRQVLIMTAASTVFTFSVLLAIDCLIVKK